MISMPYIKQEDRSKFTDMFCNLPEFKTPGEFNYAITMVCKEYLSDKGESYQTYNDLIGALECCKLEFYRRAVTIYENKKIDENGEVF